jgi:methyltransferase family protein
MDRLRCIRILMKEKKLKNFLEIGVRNGHIFFNVRSRFKIAVDPEFIFDSARKIGKIFANPYNIFNKYFPKTSDDFFSTDAPRLFAQKKISISLIDGMHEYGFALRDVENTLRYLDDGGVIIMHDCNPQSKNSACSFAEWKARNFEGVWNGDVWKAVVHLRSMRKDLHVFVLDCDQGLGIITKNEKGNLLPYTEADIVNMTYDDLNANRQAWLNLKPADYFYEYFGVK